MADEEPIGYLGGQSGIGQDDPYADPYGGAEDAYEEPQAGDPDVVPMLGGATAPEELPALPGQEDSSYSHRDFLAQDGAQAEAYADPYADPYATEGEYQDPYALPPESTSQYDEYEGYDTTAMADADPSYFDSMGHDGGDVATAPVGYDTEEFEDDDQPKTISQQDAESIIRRITTKRILPPETQQAPLKPQRLTASGGGLRMWPILLAMFMLFAGGVYMFRKPIANAEWTPAWLAKLLGKEEESGPTVDVVKKVDPEEVKKNKMLKKVLASEVLALGVDEKDVKKAGDAKEKKEDEEGE